MKMVARNASAFVLGTVVVFSAACHQYAVLPVAAENAADNQPIAGLRVRPQYSYVARLFAPDQTIRSTDSRGHVLVPVVIKDDAWQLTGLVIESDGYVVDQEAVSGTVQIPVETLANLESRLAAASQTRAPFVLRLLTTADHRRKYPR